MRERVRFVWASNTAFVIVFFSVTSLCSTEPITEDAKEANEQPWARSTRNNFHVRQDASNTMTTDRSQDFRGTANERTRKVLFMKFVQKQASCSPLFFLFCGTSSSVSLRSNRRTISKTFAVLKAMDGARNSFSQLGERAKRGMQLCPSSRTDIFKTSAKRGRACCNSIASRLAEGMNAHQIRAKATNRANTKQCRWNSFIRACSSTLKSMVPGAHTDAIKLSTEIA